MKTALAAFWTTFRRIFLFLFQHLVPLNTNNSALAWYRQIQRGSKYMRLHSHIGELKKHLPISDISFTLAHMCMVVTVVCMCIGVCVWMSMWWYGWEKVTTLERLKAVKIDALFSLSHWIYFLFCSTLVFLFAQWLCLSVYILLMFVSHFCLFQCDQIKIAKCL